MYIVSWYYCYYRNCRWYLSKNHTHVHFHSCQIQMACTYRTTIVTIIGIIFHSISSSSSSNIDILTRFVSQICETNKKYDNDKNLQYSRSSFYHTYTVYTLYIAVVLLQKWILFYFILFHFISFYFISFHSI